MAVASLVLGILWIYWVGSVLALVTDYVAQRQIRERGEQGRAMASAGIVLGWVGVGILALLVVVGVAAGLSDSGCTCWNARRLLSPTRRGARRTPR